VVRWIEAIGLSTSYSSNVTDALIKNGNRTRKTSLHHSVFACSGVGFRLNVQRFNHFRFQD